MTYFKIGQMDPNSNQFKSYRKHRTHDLKLEYLTSSN